MSDVIPMREEYSDLSNSMPMLMDWIGVRKLCAILSVWYGMIKKVMENYIDR